MTEIDLDQILCIPCCTEVANQLAIWVEQLQIRLVQYDLPEDLHRLRRLSDLLERHTCDHPGKVHRRQRPRPSEADLFYPAPSHGSWEGAGFMLWYSL